MYREYQIYRASSSQSGNEAKSLTDRPTLVSLKDMTPHLLRGNLNMRYQRDNRVVRIFLSSTFSDYKFERDALFEHVYPKLQEYCRVNGLEFQVVDMRWGVKDEASIEHTTTELCMLELDDCRILSTGPYFVGLLSHRYGSRPLQRVIEKDEFEKLASVAKDQELLQKWYKLDKNVVPAAYVLQPITVNLPDYTNNENKQRKKTAREMWWRESDALREILYCAAKKALPAEKAHNYDMSVTEREIQNGILAANSRPRDCVMFYRTVENIGSCKLANKFKDDGVQDPCLTAPGELLVKLKATVNKKVEPQSYSLQWQAFKESKESNTHTKELKNYLNSFCTDFEISLKNAVDKALKEVESRTPQTDVQKESLTHLTFCQTRCNVFYGREHVLDTIRKEVQKPAHLLPIVLHGVTGVGKTSLTAQVGKRMRGWLNKECVVIMRFIGTTVQSSSIRELLLSVAEQICEVYGHDKKVIRSDAEIHELAKTFCELLGLATKEEPLVLILDSLDQLRNLDNPQGLKWLPNQLPENVHIIVSTLPDVKHGYLQNLKHKYGDESRFVQVKDLDEKDTELVIKGILAANCRQLTLVQVEAVTDAFSHHKTPLFLKLCCDEALKWTSFQEVSKNVLQKSVEGAIEHMLSELGAKHGSLLVSRAFAYITISRFGLSESELQSILSCDDEVLQAVYEYHTPPVRILPPLLFVRLKRDVNQYLVERGAGGSKVIGWYHNQFKETVHKLLLSELDEQRKLHAKIATYFIWDHKSDEKSGYITPQPFKIGNRWNMRKLQELPYHLAGADMFAEYTDRIVLNFQWQLNKLQASGFKSLVADIEYGIECMSGSHDCSEWKRMLAALYPSEPAVMDADKYGLLPSQVLGRLRKDIGNYRRQCMEWEGQKLLPITNNCLAAPKPELKRCVNYERASCLGMTEDGTLLILGFWMMDEVRIINLKTQDVDSLKFDSGPARFIPCCNDTKCVILLENCKIHICDLSNPSECTELGFEYIMKELVSVLYERKTHLMLGTEDGMLLIYNIETGERTETPSGDFYIESMAGANNTGCLLLDDQLIVFDVGNAASPKWAHKGNVPVNLPGYLSGMACSPSGDRAMIYSHTHAFLYNMRTGKKEYEHENFSSDDQWIQGFFVKEDTFLFDCIDKICVIDLDSNNQFIVCRHENSMNGHIVTVEGGTKYVTLAQDQCLRFWEPELSQECMSKKTQNTNSGTSSPEEVIQISGIPNSSRYVLVHTNESEPENSNLYIYDIPNNALIRKMKLALLTAWKFYSATTLLATNTQMQLLLIDVDKMTIKEEYPFHLGSSCFFVLPTMKEVIGFNPDRTSVAIFNVENNSSVTINVLPLEQGEPQKESNLESEFMIDEEGTFAVVRYVNKILIIQLRESNELKVEYTLSSDNEIRQYYITKDKRYLATLQHAPPEWTGDKDTLCTVWDLQHGKQIYSDSFVVLEIYVRETDGNFYLYCARGDHHVDIHDLLTGKQLGRHTVFPINLLFPEQMIHGKARKHCVVLDYYHTYRLFDTETMNEITRFRNDEYVERGWPNLYMIDDWTLVATTDKQWNSGNNENNLRVVQLYDGETTKPETEELFRRDEN